MIDTTKLLNRIAFVMDELEKVEATTELGFGDRQYLSGARMAISKIRAGICLGEYDYAETEPAPGPRYSEDLGEDTQDDEAPEEESAKFGAFIVFQSGRSARSVDVDGEFDTRSEAWDAIIRDGADDVHYEVRPL